MPFILIYLLKVSMSLAVVFLFYRLALQRLTFYNWNRRYLLSYTFISFLVPFIDISPVLERNEWTGNNIVNWIPVIRQSPSSEVIKANVSSPLTASEVVTILICAGMIIMLIRLFIQFISFRQMMRKAEYVSGNKMKVYQVNDNIIPFSFGNAVFINQNLHTESELQEIILHEFVHIKQQHSFDIIWSEIVCLINWFNPFAWLLKKSIRQNLEFIADSKVLENGINKKEYQYLLLKVTGNNQYSIATPFNFSSLKKRIAMMNKLKSAKLNLLRFLFILPLLAVILLSFRKEITRGLKNKAFNAIKTMPGNTKDTVPGALLPVNEKLIRAANPNVKSVVIINNFVTVALKNGKTEKYNLEDIYQRIDFDKKYGSLPEPPPPPKLPEGVKDISVNGKNFATVTMENGSVEKFNLNIVTEKEKFEKKYGDIVPLPPLSPLTPQLEKLPESVERIDKNVDWVEVWIKDGKRDTFDFKIPAQKAAFEKKYGNGNIIPLPPPPPPPLPAVSSASSAPVIVAGVEIAPVSASVSNPVTVAGVSIAPVRASVTTPATVAGVRYASSSVAPVSAPDIAIASGNVAIADEAGNVMTGNEAIVITITKNTTRHELDEFVKQMKARGVEMSYDEIEYDSKGTLVNISGSLKSKTGHSNFVGQGFSKLVLALMKNGEKTWFRVSVTNGKVEI
jgi:beta-lactamase regulating signal transducer with metallopeptidase domain